jgi:rubrerythrin
MLVQVLSNGEVRDMLQHCNGGRINDRIKEGSINMPEFGSPFTGLASDRRLTNEELIRALRFMIAAEYEAVQLYLQLAESTDNKLTIKVLREIADEERVHAGEFLRLLRELAPDEDKFYNEGAKEVEEEIEKLK